MQRIRVKDILSSDDGRVAGPDGALLLKGWVRTRRDAKGFSFLEVNDGSCLGNVQVLVDHSPQLLPHLERLNTGAACAVEGQLVASPAAGQKWEVRASALTVYGEADAETYPLQKKRHSDEFLRTIAHLRPRTNKYGAMLRVRSEMALAVHSFFQSRGFAHIHAPILTGSDCEGAGEMFRVSNLEPEKAAQLSPADREAAEFFGRPANLTVSGQLEAEMLALALGDVYTFGPTFRAENSNTPKHAAEFWMVEPEMAFADLAEDMDLAEALVCSLVRHALTHCAEDLALFGNFVDKTLLSTLNGILDQPFLRLPHAEAIRVLQASGRSFEFPVHAGSDLQTEHERFLCEEHFKRPVIVYDYPKEIKAFYMRLNDDQATVAAMDLLVPRIGELVGGSQREERLDVLQARMAEVGLPSEPYWWYLDSRRYGSAPHAGFGLGFERLLMLVTGIANIRDVIPFPRTPRNLEF
ncbi:MAG: asparagine--tRNA ligase [Humidesulfovibrio sp.]|uniref:asparagine--tRNA ligase n=1 Tax=Humidesulfovibrio sp. TaxID=2910988 RepID=UPI0027F424ED|nr:asparagine--tRNA ligase [Humidesulfovibrio sp.]MDQ7835428.1 asparagine--tRNA ligase [Humidesulfovibrio sp.]